MLKEHEEKFDMLNEKIEYIKPDPPGVRVIYDQKSYNGEFNAILTAAMTKVKKEASEIMASKLKEDLSGKIISVIDENNRQKILEVNDVVVGNKGNEYYPVLVEDKDRKVRFNWENEPKSKIFNIGRFLDFFEEHYLDKLLIFQGRPTKGGGDKRRYVKHIQRIGVENGTAQDFLIIRDDKNVEYLLLHDQPIKIMDMKLKELDPYGEENWDK
jgi:hypothetical protein